MFVKLSGNIVKTEIVLSTKIVYTCGSYGRVFPHACLVFCVLTEQLAAVPRLANLGPLFKSSQSPVELTESETEYIVRCIKHTFPHHVVFQVGFQVFCCCSERQYGCLTQCQSCRQTLVVFHFRHLHPNMQ